MKKIIVIIFIIVTLILSSCSPKNDDNAKIQIWMYDYDNSGSYTRAMNAIILKLEIYCKGKNIPIEVIKYGESTLAYEDYILKRNAAMVNGNMIILDDARRLHDIAKWHADYSKVESYSKLIDAYKNRFCIPLGLGYRAIAINNEIIKHYGISLENNVISTYEYFKLIQQMKEKGANFKLTGKVYNDLLNYFMIKNEIRYLDENSEILKNKDEFKAIIKKTFIDICEDFKLYYKDINDISYLYKDYNEQFNYNLVYDEASDLTVIDEEYNYYFLQEHSDLNTLKDDIINKTFVIGDNDIFNSPCVYMYKKVTNNKIYEVFNELLTETYFKAINPERIRAYSPVLNTEKTREFLELDENWQHKGYLKVLAKNGIEKDVAILNTLNDTYELIAKDKEKSEYMADTYFENRVFYGRIHSVIKNMMLNTNVSKNDFDYSKKEIDDLINKQIDDFILDFYIHYK